MRVKKHPHAGQTGHARDFIKCANEMARQTSHRDAFSDFLEMGYCAIAQRAFPPGEQANSLEARYLKAVHRGRDASAYGTQAARMLAHLTLGLKDGCDFLGPIAAELGALNVAAGQFFTPSTVCEAMAEMTLADCTALIQEKGFISLQEPACGAGAMVLAAAKVLRQRGYDPARTMFAQATDVSPTCYRMAYLQLALADIPAYVICGDSLRGTNTEWCYTPAMLSFVPHQGARWTNWLSAPQKPTEPPQSLLQANRPRLAKPASPLAGLRRAELQGASHVPQLAHRQAANGPRRLAVGNSPPNAVDAALSFKREG